MNALLDEQRQHKPKWLRKLERESWQAELIISGVAILGCLQLPGLLEAVEDYILLEYPRQSMYIFLLSLVYWSILIYSLIAIFIFHFVVRALWIGLIGLNSVYPGGFQPNERFSPHIQERMREEYGDIDGYIQRLDRLGSGIFGIGFGVGGVFLNFGILGLIIVFVYMQLLTLGLGNTQLYVIGIVLLVVFFTVAVANMVLHSKRFHHHPTARRWHWRIADYTSRFTYLINRRYITTSLNLVTSYYADSKTFGYVWVAMMVAAGLMGGVTVMQGDNTPLFIDEVYHRLGNDSLMLAAVVAEPEATSYQGVYTRPILEPASDWPAGGMTFWVPLPQREYAEMMEQCDEPEVDYDVDDHIARQRRRYDRRRRLLTCARQYLTVQLNDRAIADYELLQAYRHNEAGEQFGLQVYVPDAPLRSGRNLLNVTTNYYHPNTEEPRRTYEPFFR